MINNNANKTDNNTTTNHKKPYHKPHSEIIRFTTEDIITTSNFQGLHDKGTGTGDDYPWPF